jgi:hypothetical protein
MFSMKTYFFIKKQNMKLRNVRFLFTERQPPIGFDLMQNDELRDFDNRFQNILRKHLTVFVCWSVLNSVFGLIALFTLVGSAYYFWMMSSVWSVVNFAVAIGFFYHTLYRKFPKDSSYERLVVQGHVERMMFLNIGIDVAYVFVGFCLLEHSFISDVSYPNLWLGFGWAIVVQGLFLMIQDVILLSLYHRNFRRAQPFFETDWRSAKR